MNTIKEVGLLDRVDGYSILLHRLVHKQPYNETQTNIQDRLASKIIAGISNVLDGFRDKHYSEEGVIDLLGKVHQRVVSTSSRNGSSANYVKLVGSIEKALKEILALPEHLRTV